MKKSCSVRKLSLTDMDSEFVRKRNLNDSILSSSGRFSVSVCNVSFADRIVSISGTLSLIFLSLNVLKLNSSETGRVGSVIFSVCAADVFKLSVSIIASSALASRPSSSVFTASEIDICGSVIFSS